MVKVLDFGLAKAMDPVGSAPNLSQSPTITTPAMTQAGMILGTAAYMSPEQAKGRAADKRSDIWAFGCVLYEMLTGARAFVGEDVSDTLAAVLRGEPEWRALRPRRPHRQVAAAACRESEGACRHCRGPPGSGHWPCRRRRRAAGGRRTAIPPRPLWKHLSAVVTAVVVLRSPPARCGGSVPRFPLRDAIYDRHLTANSGKPA
jgi:serine/threonine protein kinase